MENTSITSSSNITTPQNEVLVSAAAMTGMDGQDETSLLLLIGILVSILCRLCGGLSLALRKKGLANVTSSGAYPASRFAYLKSGIWWLGFLLFAIDQAAVGIVLIFTPAIIVALLSVLSVVGAAVGGRLILKERVGQIGWLGIVALLFSCTIFCIAAPKELDISTAEEYTALLTSLNCIIFSGVIIVALTVITIIELKLRFNYIIFHSFMIGGSSVITTWLSKGIGICLSSSAYTEWSLWVSLCINVVATLYNAYITVVASAIFEYSHIAATSYVMFSSFTILTSAVIFPIETPIDIMTGLIIGLSFLLVVSSLLVLNAGKFVEVDLRLQFKNKKDGSSTGCTANAPARTHAAVNEGYVEETRPDRNI